MDNSGKDEAVWLRWREKMPEIVSEVRYVVIDHEIFKQSMRALELSPRPRRSPTVYNWIRYTYARDVVVSIRRLLDSSKRTVSLRRLIGEVLRSPTVLAKERFARWYSRGNSINRVELYKVGLEVFESYLGEVDHIPRSVATKDLRRLDDAWSKVERIANKRILHFEPGVEVNQGVLWSDIDEIVDVVESVCSRYRLLLMQEDSGSTLLPGDWGERARSCDDFWAD